MIGQLFSLNVDFDFNMLLESQCLLRVNCFCFVFRLLLFLLYFFSFSFFCCFVFICLAQFFYFLKYFILFLKENNFFPLLRNCRTNLVIFFVRMLGHHSGPQFLTYLPKCLMHFCKALYEYSYKRCSLNDWKQTVHRLKLQGRLLTINKRNIIRWNIYRDNSFHSRRRVLKCLLKSRVLKLKDYVYVLSWLPGVCFFSKMNLRQENRSKLSFTARSQKQLSALPVIALWIFVSPVSWKSKF